MKILDEHNPFAKKLRLAKEKLNEGDHVQHNMPTTDNLAVTLGFKAKTECSSHVCLGILFPHIQTI
jgi:hypothetical protein